MWSLDYSICDGPGPRMFVWSMTTACMDAPLSHFVLSSRGLCGVVELSSGWR
jgi:hypothetical protein